MALLTNLVSYWTLNEASGPRADSHGANTLTDVNTVTSAAGIIGDAALFTALNSEALSIADNPSFSLTTAMSISFWLNQTSLVDFQTFFGKWTYQTDGEWTILAGTPSNADLRVMLATSAVDSGIGCDMLFNDVNMTAGSWFHVVVVYDGSLTGNANRLKVWTAGAARTLTVNGGAVPATLIDGGATFYMGRWGGTLTRYYNGAIDEVGLWSRALTAAEVATLYNAGAGLAYPFGEGGSGKSIFRNAIRIGL